MSLYKLTPDGEVKEIKLSEGHGLRNPTGMVRSGNQIVILDSNEVISTERDGTINWRQALDDYGVFLYPLYVVKMKRRWKERHEGKRHWFSPKGAAKALKQPELGAVRQIRTSLSCRGNREPIRNKVDATR